jgi:hypothetical protein
MTNKMDLLDKEQGEKMKDKRIKMNLRKFI